MRVVTLVSEIPGSGKTLLAGHVAAQAGAEGLGPVVVLDGDPAAGLSRWWRGRSAPNPVLGAWDASLDAAGLARLAGAGVALVVIDTPSGQSKMAEALGTPFVFLINHTQGEDHFPTAAVIALAQHGTVCPVILPQRAAATGAGHLGNPG